MNETSDSLMKYLDITEDLANRIMNHIDDLISYEQFCDLLKSRDLTYTRISRSLLHILLQIKTADMLDYQARGNCQYARLLGFRMDQSSVLTILKQTSRIPWITKLTQTDSLSETGLSMLRTDIQAANLYESVLTDKFKIPFFNEYRQQIIRVDTE